MAAQQVPLDQEPYDPGMDAPSAKRVKVTVRLSPERLERARKAVRFGYASSISDWVEEAMRSHDSNFGWEDDWEAIFAEWDRKFGPPTEEEMAWARRVVSGP